MAIENINFTDNEWEDYIRSDYVMHDTNETFSDLFTKYLLQLKVKYNVKQSEISKATGIRSTIISELKKGTRKPSLNVVILLCLAMRLTLNRSLALLYLSGNTLTNSEEHSIYKLFLSGCAFNEKYNIDNCNAMLLKHNYSMLKNKE